MKFRTRLLCGLLLPLLAGPSLAACGGRSVDPSTLDRSAETVVLLHGLGRSSSSMWLLARRLSRSGYTVHNLNYRSTNRSVSELVSDIDSQLNECCSADTPRLHFVTHSLGGILARAYIASHRPPNLGRVVMLSPPNHGSEIVDLLGDSAFFGWALGPAGQELGTAADSTPNLLGPADFELGIITGSRSLNPITSSMVPGTDDGKVSTESARLEGMSAFLVVPKTHTFIMNSRLVVDEVVHFLESGSFSRPSLDSGK